MCGIAGFCNKNIDQKKYIKKMNDAMYSRGPDAEGYFIDESTGITLGHRRLAVIDLSENGSQPMTSSSNRYVICFNGEIYNFLDIKKELIWNASEMKFRGDSDTEVLLCAFERWGIEKTLQKAKGMFAVALYDKETKKLFLMRDRMGEKPLYYGMNNDFFIFASDLNCLKQLESFQININRHAVSLFFKYGYIPGSYTIYNGIFKLGAGEILETEIPCREWHIRKYWDIQEVALKSQMRKFDGNEHEATQILEEKIRESIKMQMMADVPVGAFLSGGTDSSLVVALMQSQSSQKVNTFTIGMMDSSMDEAKYARDISQYIGTNHTELYLNCDDIKEVFMKLPEIYSEPFADNSQIATYLVSKLARKDVTVSLSGDAGDELFCGYTLYSELDKIYNSINYRCGNESDLMKEYSISEYKMNHYKKARTIRELHDMYFDYSPLLRKIVLNKEETKNSLNSSKQVLLNNLEELMLGDMQQYLVDDILVKVDRAGMAVSLENRVPLLDKDIVEFAWSLPIEFKRNDGVNKKILKNILFKYVPKQLMDRPKTGFNIPIKEIMRSKEMMAWGDELLHNATMYVNNLVDRNIILSFWNEFKQNGTWKPVIWYAIVFELWCQKNLSAKANER